MFSTHTLREAMRAHKCDDLFPIWSKLECKLSACIALLSVQLDYVAVSEQFFFLLSVWPRYTLSRNKLIHGGIGSTLECNFYMGMQNGSKNEIWHENNLIHALEFKLRSLEVLPCVCIGKRVIQV